MGGPKWLKPKSGPKAEKKKQRGNQRAGTDKRKKLAPLGLPDFGKYEPERFKRRRLEGGMPVNSGKPPSSSLAAVAALAAAAQRSEAEHARKEELMRKEDDGFTREMKGGKENSYKTYYKEFRKVIEASDVILEVLDARDPMGCRCLDIERSVSSEFNNTKKFILVLNKVDLVPREFVEGWMNELRETMEVAAFTTTKGGITSRCTDGLFKLLNEYCAMGGLKKSITVGVIGYPNVGKSSIINTLKRKTVAAVGNTPGFTTAAKEIQLRSNITIMDCPGIVFSADKNSTSVMLRNAMKIEQIEDPISPVEKILELVDKSKILKIYNLPDFKDCDHFLTQVAVRKGKVGKRCEPMLDDTARLILKDWNDGLIPFYTIPAKTEGFMANKDTVPTESQRANETLILQGLPSLGDVSEDITGIVNSKTTVRFATADVEPRRGRGKKRGFDDASEAISQMADGDMEEMDEYEEYEEEEDAMEG